MKTHSFGDYHFSPHAVFSSIADAAEKGPSEGWDFLILTTKALPDVTDDSKDIEPLVRKAPDGKTSVMLIQNGVGIEEAHRSRFPQNPIISAVTIASAEQISHGVIKQNRWTRISMGPYSDGFGGKSEKAKALHKSGHNQTKELARLMTDHGKIRDAE
ncbi:hypothetical protein LTS18_008308, partial [Coniosporium uncinatum]